MIHTLTSTYTTMCYALCVCTMSEVFLMIKHLALMRNQIEYQFSLIASLIDIDMSHCSKTKLIRRLQLFFLRK